jgi:hypothetical protein
MTGTGTANGNNVMAQAMQAMMRGESPQSFMQNLIAHNPNMSAINVNDLQVSATKLCNERGIDVSNAVNEIKTKIKQ